MIFLGNNPIGISALVSQTLKKASGVFSWSSSLPARIVHNLGTRKVLIVMQRVNSDYGVVTGDEERCIAVLAATKEAIAWDTEQTYRASGGSALSFDDAGTGETYPGGFYISAPGDGNTALNNGGITCRPDRGAVAEDINTVTIYPGQNLTDGRWTWTAYAIG